MEIDTGGEEFTSGPRQLLADALADGLPESVKVVGAAENVSPEPGHDVVIVSLDEVKPGAYSGSRLVSINVIAAVAKTTPGAADDALEEHLANVLAVLDVVPWVDWRSAKRSLYAPSEDSAGFPAFSIEIEIHVRTTEESA